MRRCKGRDNWNGYGVIQDLMTDIAMNSQDKTLCKSMRYK
jgi:hypothetical protein